MDEIKDWKYYNHAMIPTVAPHEEVDLEPVASGNIWKNKKKTFLAAWTSDWNCGYETNWWYVIREGPFDFSELSTSSKRNIRKALRNCRVEKINPTQYVENLWRVYNETIQRYENFAIKITKDKFIRQLENRKPEEEYWAGFDSNSGIMIGYAIFIVHTDWVMFHKSRYSTPYLKLRVSDAINARILEYYLNEKQKKYVSDGMRSILHKTNFQQYLIDHFGYKKIYCNLHVRYRKWVKILVDIAYPMRHLLQRIDWITRIHQLNGLLTMEEIVRTGELYATKTKNGCL